MSRSRKVRIVKVQIPLMSNDPNVGCLVYGKGHKGSREQTITQKNFDDLKGDLKGYFEAWLNFKTNCWVIGKRVEDQDW